MINLKNIPLKDNPDFEVAESGYADFEEDGVRYRRKKRFFLGAIKATPTPKEQKA